MDACREGISVKHNGFGAVQQNSMFTVKPHGARKHKAFKITAAPDKVGKAVPVGDADRILFDDGSLVKLFGNEMACRPDNLHTPLIGLTIGVPANKSGEEKSGEC